MQLARLWVKEQDRVEHAVWDGEAWRVVASLLEPDERPGEVLFEEKVELLAPVAPPNVLAIGRNYREHAAETGSAIPERPLLFLKATTAVTAHGAPIRLPAMAPAKVDLEAELAVVIGKTAKDVPEAAVDEVILGFTCANDVSARDCELELDSQWARGKSFDTFCPLGPWIETDLEPDDLRVRSTLNGETMQDSRTSNMIFPCRELVSFLSRCMTLLPGTVILTGTPPGVGMARNPPVFLKEGDQVEVTVEGIGTLANPVVA